MTVHNFHKETLYKIRPSTLISMFLVMATLVVYLQVINHSFVDYDDDLYVFENIHVQKGLIPKNILWALTTSHAANWHPLTWLSHMLDMQLYGMNSGLHHLTSVIFHMINAILLFALLRRSTGALWPSSFVAALFALHPLHVESVAWVAERKDVLSTFFWMLTLWSYIRYVEEPGVNRYLTVLLFFILGLMAKPMLVTLPFVMLLLDYWPLERFSIRHAGDTAQNSQKMFGMFCLFREKIPFFVLSITSSVVTFLVQKEGGAVGDMAIYPLFARISNALVSYVSYIGKMIWPSRLAVLYPFPPMFPVWQLFGAGLLLISAFFIAIYFIKHRPWFTVGWFWYLGTLLPVIGLVQMGAQAMADRYTYVPMIGLFIIVAWGLPELLAKWQYKRFVLAPLAATIIAILMVITWVQIRYWENSYVLFKHALEVTSDNWVVHNNFGNTLRKQGDFEEAIWHFHEALRINPDYETAHLNIGIALMLQGKLDASIAYYNEVLSLKPELATIHNNLGVVLLRKGRLDEAIIHFQKAIRLAPDYAEAYNSLGLARVYKGEMDKAIVLFRKALSLKPDFILAQKNLSKVLAIKNKTSHMDMNKSISETNI
jgi:Tfp pilus assembly protein PilF